MKFLLCLIFFIIFSFTAIKIALAESSYVLPYPSSLPGSRFYQLHLIWKEIMGYWNFGNFGQFNYNLKQSDKYLVEAKTLFEYKQFLLGYKALLRSNFYFKNTMPFLLAAKKENKDISQKMLILKDAAVKHTEVLTKVRQDIPETFLWSPEKSQSTILELKKIIDRAINLRKNVYE